MQHPESPRAAARPRRAPPGRGAPHPESDGATLSSRRGASGEADGKRRNPAATAPGGSEALRRPGHRSHRANGGRAGPRGAPQPLYARSRDARTDTRTHARTHASTLSTPGRAAANFTPQKRRGERTSWGSPAPPPPTLRGAGRHFTEPPPRRFGSRFPLPTPRGGGAARRYLRAPRLTPSLRRRRAREPSTAAGGEGRRGGPGAERCGRKGHLGSSPPLLSARGRALPPAPLGQV